ncbi:MAG: hypothetical protein AVDCRST_MAG31-703, partial [uncultured Sphingomonas sp.]
GQGGRYVPQPSPPPRRRTAVGRRRQEVERGHARSVAAETL